MGRLFYDGNTARRSKFPRCAARNPLFTKRLFHPSLSLHYDSWHVHERSGTWVDFIVAGHGGYYHLHSFNRGVEKGTVDDNNGATLVACDDKNHGYLTLSVDDKTINGFMTTIDRQTEEANPEADTFEYSAKALFLADGDVVSL
jgi:hypothetical protein